MRFFPSYFHRMNGFGAEQRAATSPAQPDTTEAPLGGLFTRLAKQQGGPPRLPAFPVMLDMSSTKVCYINQYLIFKKGLHIRNSSWLN